MDLTTETNRSGESADEITLGLYAERAYLDYAVSVVKGRALPDVCDGQKPVQRRILYAMKEMGLVSGTKPMKSARVVGDVLGKFHPHGDQAAYDALVRMAQNFSLRYPLIDGQGNFGSRDGDGAAAMRYTEARLTPIAGVLLDEIDMGTVDFMPTYDGTLQEPKILPARLPMVLLNGASGIAVGMATEIASHHLSEVASAVILLIQNEHTPLCEIMAVMPGPDFPGGAHIISPPEAITDIYTSGRGSLKVRARWLIEDLARSQWQLVVTELPPNTSAASIMSEIEELTNPKIKLGKKTLTSEQQNLKQTFLAVLDTVRDESGKNAAVRLVFEPKSRNVELDAFVTLLLAHTSLECNVSINLVSIARDGRPGQRGLIPILLDWIAFRLQTVCKRCEHRLSQVLDRLHVLQGRMTAWLHIDEVITTIRESDEPKAALIARFSLSERQAEDILELRLRQLAKLEKIRIEQEISQLQVEEIDLKAVLNDEGLLRKLIIREIRKDEAKFGDQRRTLIQTAQKTIAPIKPSDEPLTVIVSARYWLRTRLGHGHDSASFGFKAGDSLGSIWTCRSTDTLIAFGASTALNRVYSIAVSALPRVRGDGVPLQSLIELPSGGQVSAVMIAPAQTRLLLAGTGGYGLICRHEDLQTRQRAGKSFLSLESEETLLGPYLLNDQDTHCAVLSSLGRFYVFAIDELKLLAGGGRGVQCLPLKEGEILLAIMPFGLGCAIEIYGQGRGGKTQVLALKAQEIQERIGKRGGRGRVLEMKFKPQGLRLTQTLF